MTPEKPEKSRRRRLRRIITAVLLTAVGLLVLLVLVVFAGGFRAFFPTEYSTRERLESFPSGPFPVDQPITIHWNGYQVPFIEAANDGDLAFALGLVHAHLRGAQIALLKRISQGRLAEIAGPPVADLDEALRIINLGYAVPEIVMHLEPDTRNWLQRFVEGLNYYQDHAAVNPPEFALFGLTHEPYTIEDVLTIGRLASVDVNWLTYIVLLSKRQDADWPEIWRQAVQTGLSSPVSIGSPRSLDQLSALLGGLSRSGSNCVVIGGAKTADGHGAIASDPHLGITVPNTWLLAGFRSPTTHCVGLMIPGVPFVALGRNPTLAWGGTNMRSASSDIYDVSALPPDSFAARTERIAIRFWPDREITLRRSPYGPVLTDSRLIPARPGEVLALRWVGHQVSDEIGAFLKANRARSIGEFAAAFQDYAVSGQNMLVVDSGGNIGMALAVRLPVRQGVPDKFVLRPDERQAEWDGYCAATELPVAYNPSDGYIASANNRPTDHNPPIGWLFGPADRFERLCRLLDTAASIDLEWLKGLQHDVYSAPAHRMAAHWGEEIARFGLDSVAPELSRALTVWDGNYAVSSRGPVAFETLAYHLVHEFRGDSLDFYRVTWNYLSRYFAADLDAAPEENRRLLVARALRKAAPDFQRFVDWGAMHRQRAAYVLGDVPLVGRLFVWDEYPTAGSRETIMKTNHELSNQQTTTSYGSQSRHISLMGDPDENYFVLFGGQDGWLGSANLVDQVSIWKKGEYLRIPLDPRKVEREWEYNMVLSPGDSTTLVEANGQP